MKSLYPSQALQVMGTSTVPEVSPLRSQSTIPESLLSTGKSVAPSILSLLISPCHRGWDHHSQSGPTPRARTSTPSTPSPIPAPFLHSHPTGKPASSCLLLTPPLLLHLLLHLHPAPAARHQRCTRCRSSQNCKGCIYLFVVAT